MSAPAAPARTGPWRERLPFPQGFLRHPAEVGSVIPSSRWLEQRLVRAAGLGRAHVIVELGPGTRGTTRALLRAMPPGARRLLGVAQHPAHARLHLDAVGKR